LTINELQPGLLIMRNIISLVVQQQFIDLSFALGTPKKKKIGVVDGINVKQMKRVKRQKNCN